MAATVLPRLEPAGLCVWVIAVKEWEEWLLITDATRLLALFRACAQEWLSISLHAHL
jgi:hypothetical protein